MAQGTYASDNEIHKVVQCLECEPCYAQELVQLKTGGREGQGGLLETMRERDELYETAIDIVIREGRGSVSLLQRTLGIGYGRAARLIDFMAEDGIVGAYNGSSAREVLYKPVKAYFVGRKMNSTDQIVHYFTFYPGSENYEAVKRKVYGFSTDNVVKF